MKKIGLLLLAITLISSLGFAKNNTVCLNESNIISKKINESLKNELIKSEIKNLVLPVTLNLSCCTVTFTGATGDAAMQLIFDGYAADLVAFMDWFACQGGYRELNPPITYNYA